MAFTPRLNAPSTSNKFYYSLNRFYKSGYGLPNCTCYAWGRAYEVLGKAPKLSLGNAEDWYGYTKDGYKRGKTPQVGAVICWKGGKTGYGSDGAGHVAFVEKVYSNGDILTSNSAWGGTRFYTKTLKKSNNYSMGSGFQFQGFIYVVPASKTKPATTTSTATKYAAGKDYKLQANMKVRTGAGTKYRQKKRSELTVDGKKHALSGTYACLKKGTVVTCQKVIKSGSDIWLKIPSGYVCAKQGKVTYIK